MILQMEFFHPAQRFRLALHGRADEISLGNFRKHKRQTPEKDILMHAAGTKAARIDHQRSPFRQAVRLLDTQGDGAVDILEVQSTVTRQDQSWHARAQAPFFCQAQVAGCIRQQTIGTFQRLASLAGHQKRRARVESQVVAPDR